MNQNVYTEQNKMMSFQFELDEKDEASSDFISDVGEQLQLAFITAKQNDKLNQKSLADKLSVDKSHISRCLSGYNNMTLRTLAELAWALDCELNLKMCPNKLNQTQNFFDNRSNNITTKDGYLLYNSPVVERRVVT